MAFEASGGCYASVAQLVERILAMDEVTGSKPARCSKSRAYGVLAASLPSKQRDPFRLRIGALKCFYMLMVDERTLNPWVLVRVQIGALTFRRSSVGRAAPSYGVGRRFEPCHRD